MIIKNEKKRSKLHTEELFEVVTVYAFKNKDYKDLFYAKFNI